MKSDVARKLKRLSDNYREIQGREFTHFYCPILYRDEDTPLCKAHIINRAFRKSPRSWTIQRRDIDSFFGSKFEADFVDIADFDNANVFSILLDPSRSERYNATVFVGGKKVDHFFAKKQISDKFTNIQFDGLHTDVSFGLKMRPEEFREIEGTQLEVEVQRDVSVQMLVSVIKSAHLTLFEMLGYRYAFSAAGEFVGRQILGAFFTANQSKSKTDVQKSAVPYFREYVHMARPLISSDMGFQGTITDRQLLMCIGSSGRAWASIVFIRTANKVHSVLLPAFDEPDRVATYMDFLSNDNEWIQVANCKFEGENWAVSKDTKPLRWPKRSTESPLSSQ